MDIKHLVNGSDWNSAESFTSRSIKRNVQDDTDCNKRIRSAGSDEVKSFDTYRINVPNNINRLKAPNQVKDISKYGITYDGSEFEVSSNHELLKALSLNCDKILRLNKIRFQDSCLPKFDSFESLADAEQISIKQDVVDSIHKRYVKPLFEINGYKWIRKEVPSKGKGSKVFSVKYCCSQQKLASKKTTDRSRQLTHPLKEFDCESKYSIKYTWSTQTIEVSYNHIPHPPYKRLPEKLKSYIVERLNMKAVDLYNEILNEEKFGDIKHLIFFSKVQSYWSKERTKRKHESTKEAFKKFFNE